MQLSLQERAVLQFLLPSQGSFTDLLCREDLIAKVKLTQEDIEEFDIKSLPSGGIAWSEEKAEGKTWEVEISELEKNAIKAQLKKLSEDKKLGAEHLTLAKEFKIEE